MIMLNVTENEQRAMTVGTSKVKLERYLREARWCLNKKLRAVFGKGRFDYRNKRLVSQDGAYALVWKLRRKPDEPISYENQQTSRGFVVCVKLSDN